MLHCWQWGNVDLTAWILAIILQKNNCWNGWIVFLVILKDFRLLFVFLLIEIWSCHGHSLCLPDLRSAKVNLFICYWADLNYFIVNRRLRKIWHIEHSLVSLLLFFGILIAFLNKSGNKYECLTTRWPLLRLLTQKMIDKWTQFAGILLW